MHYAPHENIIGKLRSASTVPSCPSLPYVRGGVHYVHVGTGSDFCERVPDVMHVSLSRCTGGLSQLLSGPIPRLETTLSIYTGASGSSMHGSSASFSRLEKKTT